MKTVIVRRRMHDGGIRVILEFQPDEEIIRVVKTLPDATWNKSMKYWHIEPEDGIDSRLVDALSGVARIEFRYEKTINLIERVKEARNRDSTEVVSRSNGNNSSGRLSAEAQDHSGVLSLTIPGSYKQLQKLDGGAQVSPKYSQDIHIDAGGISEVCFAEGSFRMYIRRPCKNGE
ncbi:MAG: hypothetical protein MZV63_30300 [Marinilabiliales bacterium]|nr:hypothetical protein [Marinilabiliales bacterium]